MRFYLISFILVLLNSIGFAQVHEVRLSEKTNSVSVRNNENGLSFSFKQNKLLIKEKTSNDGQTFNDIWFSGSYPTGEIGTPKLPAFKKLIRIPKGSKPIVKINSYSQQEINLKEKGFDKPIIPNQPSVRKDQDSTKIKFEIKKESYSKNEYIQPPLAKVEILGTLRSATIARLVVSPVDYNPQNNSIKVYNDIDVSVDFENVNSKGDQDLAAKTNSPYFDVVYKAYAGATKNSYDEHPDLTKYPVKMLIVSDRIFEQSLQPFIAWKKLKGFKVITAYTDIIGSTSDQIKAYIQQQYNSATPEDPAPTFLVLVGDIGQIPASATGSSTGSSTDLYYASVDGDMFPEMYYGRLSATTTDQLNNILNKILYYEKYQFADPSYLNNVTLIAGADGTYNNKVGQPTIKYSTANYFNSGHGFNTVNEYGVENDPNNSIESSSYSGCYDAERISVGIINYTAHGSQTSWVGPALSNSSIASFSNANKYPLAIANCCLSGDFGYSECFGEAWIRAQNKGAVTYIGSAPETFWYEDFYWAVGAFNLSSQADGYVPTFQETTTGVYDAPYVSSYVTTGAMVFVGNLAVTEADIQGYSNNSSPIYYWQAYNVLGDPSLIPYFSEAEANQISHKETITNGVSLFKISTLAGSYIALTKDDQLIGTIYNNQNGEIDVPITTLTTTGDIVVVVTRPQTIPYIDTITAINPTGPYLQLSSFSIDDHLANNNGKAEYNESIAVNLNIKNIGIENATNVKVKISGIDSYISLNSADSIGIADISSEGGVNFVNVLSAFSFTILENVPDQHQAKFTLKFYSDQGSWSSNLKITLNSPVITLEEIQIDDETTGNKDGFLNPGESCHAFVKVVNKGHAIAKNISSNVSIPDSLINVFYAGGILTESFSIEPNSFFTLHFRVSSSPSYFRQTQLPVILNINVLEPSGQSNSFTKYIKLIPKDITKISNDTLQTCFTYFYDSGGENANYSNSENYTTTFIAKNEYSCLRVKFSEFSTELNYDMLYVYNGANINSPQVPGSPFHGTTIPAEIVSNGRYLTFRFRSDSNNASRGWKATIECINSQTIPVCATNPTPSNEAVGVQSTTLNWSQPAGATFYDVFIGAASDNLVFDGRVDYPSFSFKAEKSKTYYWKVASGNYLGTNNSGCETWNFTTDTIANQILMSNGTLEVDTSYFFDSGGSSAEYKNNELYTLTLKPRYTSNSIEVIFLAFNIENNSTCSYDKLSIYDGLSTSSTLIGNYCGTNSPDTIKASNPDGALTFQFKSDGGITYSGWKAIVRSIGTATFKTLTFNVKDNGIPVPNACINIGGSIKITDINGIAAFNVVPGTINYQIYASGFAALSNQVSISSSDVTENVNLTKQRNVSIHVTDALSNPLHGAKIIYNSDSVYTSSLGVASMNLPLGNNSLSVQAMGFEPLIYSSNITNETTSIEISLTPKNYNVKFRVTDANGVKIENALVNINSNILTTNAQGIATGQLTMGCYNYTVSKSGFFPLSMWLMVNDTISQNIQLDSNPSLYNVEFTFYGSGPKGLVLLDNVDISLYYNKILYSLFTTSSQGKGIQQLPIGTFQYTTQREGYISEEGKKVVVDGILLSFKDTLIQKTFTVDFIVNTSSGFVQDATITLNGYHPLNTTNQGTVIFDAIGYEKNLQYLVQKDGFFNTNGYIDVVGPVVVNIDLILNSAPVLSNNLLRIYPNPTSDLLNIYSEKPIVQLQVISITGKVLENIKTAEIFSTTLSMNKYTKGAYIIAIYFKNDIPAKSLVIKN